jgi:hypothetical protein
VLLRLFSWDDVLKYWGDGLAGSKIGFIFCRLAKSNKNLKSTHRFGEAFTLVNLFGSFITILFVCKPTYNGNISVNEHRFA